MRSYAHIFISLNREILKHQKLCKDLGLEIELKKNKTMINYANIIFQNQQDLNLFLLNISQEQINNYRQSIKFVTKENYDARKLQKSSQRSVSIASINKEIV